MRLRSLSPRLRGEGRGEGPYQQGSDSRKRPLTRIAEASLRQSDLSPHAGRGGALRGAGVSER
jgi:hypothetical protein